MGDNKYMKNLVLIIILLCIVSSMCGSFLGWEVLKSRYYTVFYNKDNERDALETLNALHNYRPQVSKLTGTDVDNLAVVIEDIGIISNGLANPVFNYIRVFTNSPRGQTSVENWAAHVGKHELIHIHHFNNVSGVPRSLRTVLGRLLMPNIYTPGWIYEGIAVYGESRDRLFTGRINDGYFDTYMRIRANENDFPSILEATFSPEIYPFREGIYLYGGTFFQYLSDTYGEEKFAEFFTDFGSSMRSFLSPIFPYVGLDRSARSVYGKPFTKLWSDWKRLMIEESEPYNISGERLTNHGYYIDQLQFYNDELYYSRRYREKTGSHTMFGFNKIKRIDNQDSNKTLISTTTPIIDFIVKDNLLWYSVYEFESSYNNTFLDAYGYQGLIRVKDLQKGNDRKVLQDNLRTFTIIDDNILIYSQDRTDKFGSHIYRYHTETNEKYLLLSTNYLIDRIQIYDGRIFVTARSDWQNFSLYELILDRNELTKLVVTPYVEQIVDVSQDKVFFTANYGGSHKLYYYDLNSEKVYATHDKGFIKYAAFDSDNGNIYLAALEKEGFEIYKNRFDYDLYQLPDCPFEKPILHSISEIDITKGSYFDNLKTLLPAVRIPIFYSGTNEETYAGMYLGGTDAIGHFSYGAEFIYEFDKQGLDTEIFIRNKLYPPLITDLYYRNKDKDHEIDVAISRPLLKRLQSGLSHLTIKLQARMFESFDRTSYTPLLAAGFHYPGFRGELIASTPWESSNYGSNIDRLGIHLNSFIMKYLYKSHLAINTIAIYDPDNPDNVFPKIRGYKEEIDGNQGGLIRCNLSKRLLTINKGLWNPNIYFEDLNATLFIDGAVPETGPYQAAGGIELTVDGGMLFLVNSLWGLRLSYNREKEITADIFFGTGISW